MTTLAAAGLPMLQRANPGHIVATQSILERTGAGILFDDWDDLAARLRDPATMEATRDRIRDARDAFTFDAHTDRLVAFFRTTIERSGRSPAAAGPAARHSFRRAAEAAVAATTPACRRRVRESDAPARPMDVPPSR
jgi:hypothetical protein